MPVELTDGGTDVVEIRDSPAAGTHLRRAGEDLAAGAVALSAGSPLGAAQLGLAAAVGLTELPVRRRPRVLVLSTGSELVSRRASSWRPGRSTSPTRCCWPPPSRRPAGCRAGCTSSPTTSTSSSPPSAPSWPPPTCWSPAFEPPPLANGLPNPRHLPLPVYLALVRRAAVRGARRNGVDVGGADVSFPGGGFAPTRVAVRVHGVARVRVKPSGGGRGEAVPVKARATAEIAPDLNVPLGMPAFGSGGGYDGPIAYRMGKPMRPDVAAAFDRMAAAAREEAGLFLSIISAFRSDAEQARLFAANPNPHLFSACRVALGAFCRRRVSALGVGPEAAPHWPPRKKHPSRGEDNGHRR